MQKTIVVTSSPLCQIVENGCGGGEMLETDVFSHPGGFPLSSIFKIAFFLEICIAWAQLLRILLERLSCLQFFALHLRWGSNDLPGT